MVSKSNNNSLAIIIPMYNEEKSAASCIDQVLRQLGKIQIPTQLIVVDDGSRDNTKQILRQKALEYKQKLVIVTNKVNLGYGGALQNGIREAIKRNFEFYLTMDSDLTNPPEDIMGFVKVMPLGFDCIKASRYIKGGRMVNVPFFRRAVSTFGNLTASLLLNVGVRDCTNGFKMVRLDLLRDIHFREKNFSIILEEMYYLKKKKAKFYEIPNVLYARKNSKSHFRYRPRIFYDYFKYLVRAFFV